MRAVLFFGLAFIISCSSLSPEEKTVLKAVTSYNVALIQTYGDVNLNYMQFFASEAEIKKLFPIIQALMASGNRMVARQDEFVVKSIKIKGDAATLRAEEKWTYWWEDVYTGEVTKPKAEQKYKINYMLKKVNGRWIVDSLKPWGK
ncbi:MAG: hypothetical protein Q8J64_10495 [Thermodesulfovibrionales bacterium]|nr:hypothetical protein [Thermodesulfovibrionales bacterium]